MPSRTPVRSTEESVDVLVVGAGPTGLTAAVVLAMSGATVAVLERDAGPIDQSRALLVHPRTLELWRPLGVTDEALRRGRVFDRIDVHVSGRPRGRLFYDGDGLSAFPSGLVLEQKETQRLLLDRLAELGPSPRWSHSVTGIVEDDRGVVATVTTPTGEAATIRGRYVIAADGASSTVREGLGLILEGATYASSFFLADLVMRAPLNPSRLHLSVAGTHFHAFFPMAGENRWRVIGSLHPEQVERYAGRDTLGSRATIPDADIRAIVARSRLPVEIDEVGWASMYRIHQRIVGRYRVGRRFLAGDAAHIHSPAGGQGMNTGIADAVNLAWKLAAVVTGRAQEALLDTYEAERRPAAQDVLASSDRLFRLEASTSPAAGRVRSHLLPTLSAVLSSTAYGRRAFFGRLAQTEVSYRDVRDTGEGALRTAGVTGRRVAAGDRLPFVPLEGGRTTHDLVDATRHVLLVIPGRAPGGMEIVAARLGEVLDRYRIGVEQQVVTPLRRGLPVAPAGGPTAILVRPDGHLAHVGSADDPAGLDHSLARRYRPIPTALAGADAGGPAALAPGRYRIDPEHTRVTLHTRHLFGLGSVDGGFALAEAADLVVGDDGRTLSGGLRFATASLRTGSARRDRDVQAPRFLDGATHPTIDVYLHTFERFGARHRVLGTLTVRGTTALLVLDVDELTAVGPDMRAHATARVDRVAHGITAARGMAGRWIDLTVDVLAHVADVPVPSDAAGVVGD